MYIRHNSIQHPPSIHPHTTDLLRTTLQYNTIQYLSSLSKPYHLYITNLLALILLDQIVSISRLQFVLWLLNSSSLRSPSSISAVESDLPNFSCQTMSIVLTKSFQLKGTNRVKSARQSSPCPTDSYFQIYLPPHNLPPQLPSALQFLSLHAPLHRKVYILLLFTYFGGEE